MATKMFGNMFTFSSSPLLGQCYWQVSLSYLIKQGNNGPLCTGVRYNIITVGSHLKCGLNVLNFTNCQ